MMTAQLETLLDVRDTEAWYGRAEVLHKITVTVGRGEVVGLFGHNGAGKSTLLRVIAGLHSRCAGQIEFDGKSFRGLKPHDRARRGLVMVREGAHVFSGLSVHEHLVLGARLGKISGRPSENVDVYSVLPMLGPLKTRMAGFLSGGQRQMLCLGMALASQATCLALDEPSTGLAPAVSDLLYAAIESLAATGVTFLIAEQNPAWLARVANRGYVMEVGHIVREGAPDELINKRTLSDA
jgi:branched-chain amino acid transport system ATP-binding protein